MYETMLERMNYLMERFNFTPYQIERSWGELSVKTAQTQYSKFKNGKAPLSNSIIYSVCKKYNVNIFWLVDGEGDVLVGEHAPADLSEVEKENLLLKDDIVSLNRELRAYKKECERLLKEVESLNRRIYELEGTYNSQIV